MTARAILAGMTHNCAPESSDVPNGEIGESPHVRINTETPTESLPMIPPLPEPRLRPRHEIPAPANPWDLLWFW